MASVTTAANICEEAVPVGEWCLPAAVRLQWGGNAGQVAARQPDRDDDGRRRRCGDLGRRVSSVRGAYDIPTVTLTESDLRGPVKVQPRMSRKDLFNVVKGTFVNPGTPGSRATSRLSAIRCTRSRTAR